MRIYGVSYLILLKMRDTISLKKTNFSKVYTGKHAFIILTLFFKSGITDLEIV